MATAEELLTQWVVTFNQMNWSGAQALMAPDAVAEEIGTGRTLNAEQALEAAKEWKRAFPNGEGRIQNRIVSGNQAVGEILWRGNNTGPFMGNPPTGKRAEVRAVVIIEERDGKIARVRHYIDVASLMQQLGMAPAATAAAGAR